MRVEHCPDERVWDEIATGLLTDNPALAYLDHASVCLACGQSLRAAMEVFDAEEQVMAARHWGRWLAYAATLLLVAGLGLFFWWKKQSEPMVLLARAYTTHRTMDLRLPGVAHGPMQLQRGDTADQPVETLEAELAIRRTLEANSHDLQALYAKGRLALLKGQAAVAIESLEAARDWGNAEPALLVELAIAYCERGRQMKQATDKMHAVEILSTAIEADPKFAAALFNRALIEDELNLMSAAIADLERLLIVEPAGPWSDESKAMLVRVRARHAQFFERITGEDAARFAEVALDKALRNIQDAEVKALAKRFAKEHQDPWLTELLAVPQSAATMQAARVLAKMVDIRISVESGRYAEVDEEFFQLYKVPLPAPYALWRDFELSYRAARVRVKPCPPNADAVVTAMGTHQYQWLRTQVLREQATCDFLSGRREAAEVGWRTAAEESQRFALPVSEARARSMLINVARRSGQYRQTLNLVADLLADVVKRRLPVARSHEFVNHYTGLSQELNWPHAARISASAMTETATVAGFKDLRFTNQVLWAQLELRAGNADKARELFQGALGYYQSLAPNHEFRAWAEIGFAEASGDVSGLVKFAPELETTPAMSSMVWIPYQRVRSALALKRGDTADAERRLQKIIDWLDDSNSRASSSNHWHMEFRSASQLFLQLLLQQGKTKEAFSFLQQTKAFDEKPFVADVPKAGGESARLLFSFSILGDKVAAWRKSGNAVEFRWLDPSVRDLERLVTRFNRLTRSPESDLHEVDETGRQLTAALFGPWMESLHVGGPALVQVDTLLASMPFAALPGKAAPFGVEHPLALTTRALTEPGAAGSVPEQALSKLLLVDGSAGSYAMNGLLALPSAAREIAAIHAVTRSEVLSGKGASPAEIARLASGAGGLHFAGHATLTPGGAALVLPDERAPVTVMDLRRFGFSMPGLVVLSACSTASESAPGDAGPGSLASAFISEGSREVIASLWNVDSESTAELMSAYYRQLAGGVSSGEAFRRAIAGLHQSGKYPHPYYWSAFARFVRAEKGEL